MGYFKEKSKKWGYQVALAGAMLFCVSVLVLLFPAKEVFAQATGTVTANSANIRASADVNSEAVASVLKGNTLTIIEQVTGADGNTWYKVFVDANSTGYVRADLISKGEGTVPTGNSQTTQTPSTPAETTPQVNTTVTVNTDGVEAVQPISGSVKKDNVRVRANSTTNSDIVTTVKKDVVFTVHGTKENGNETWYQVSFTVDGTAVNGYIRSDFVNLSGDLLPVTETETPPVTEPEEVVPEVPEEKAAYEAVEKEGVWYLIDNTKEQQYQYQISSLITEAEKNANDLEAAQKKLSKQTGIIVFLAIVLVILVLGVTVLVFKIKDMMEDEGFDVDERNARRRQAPSNRPVQSRPAGARPAGARPAGARPAGARPAGARPAGARPEGSKPATASNGNGRQPVARPTGNRPAGSRPAGTAPTGTRPTSGNRPAGTQNGSRPVTEKPMAERPVAEKPVTVSEEKVTNQARANVESRELEKGMAKAPTWQSKNFMADDDEFEFEFLNWDGEEEK